jgi:hypothetical protein
MLGFFKKNRDKKPLQNWQIPIDAQYRLINNGDSIQFVNADESLILYFSLLTTTNNSLLASEVVAKMQPSVTRSENGWQFKGARSGGKEVLVCVFSFINESDEALVKELFANIVYIGK